MPIGDKLPQLTPKFTRITLANIEENAAVEVYLKPSKDLENYGG